MKNKSINHKEAGMDQVTFTVEKMFRLPEAGHLKGFADVAVNGVLVIRGVRLMEGKKGMFISMPREQGKDNKWYDQVICKEASVFDALSKVVMDCYMSECA